MLNWCDAIMNNECADFESTWSLNVTNLDTPEKQKKRSRHDGPTCEETAAVADAPAAEDVVSAAEDMASGAEDGASPDACVASDSE